MSGNIQIELLYSNICHCKLCISRVSLLIDENTCCILLHSKIKQERLKRMYENVDSFACAVYCIVNDNFISVGFVMNKIEIC
jgi:hypothetical protein